MTIRIIALLLTLLLAGLTQAPGASAQKGSKMYRLGWVSLVPAPTQSHPSLRSPKGPPR